MLKQLTIQNIILVNKATIDFTGTLNVLTGETGSGKSAVITALHLILGERSSTEIIRHGASTALVEALFDIDSLPIVIEILKDAGIDHESGEYLILRREIQSTGKSRAFINNQMAQVSLLQKVGRVLIDSVGQHANQRLQNLDYHRQVLDTFAGLEADIILFKHALMNEEKLREQLDSLINGEAIRLREIERCRHEIDELLESSLKDGEEESLFSEYTLLANSEELSTLVNSLEEGLSGENGVLKILSSMTVQFDQLTRLNPTLSETATVFKSALIELQEVNYTLQNYSGKIEFSPQRLEEINERLSLINRLKRKYGNSIKEMQKYLKQTQTKISELENADLKIEELQKELSSAEQKTNSIAQALTFARTSASLSLSEKLESFIRKLNMPNATFHIYVSPQKRTYSGDDKIEFSLAPNVGEKAIPLKSCASGGELSRVMLAIKAILAGKEALSTLIFDEIDANIGGETANIVGEALSEIAQKHQVLCITHFPQVARHAKHHLKIAKGHSQGRTLTTITPVSSYERDEELRRMLGGEKLQSLL